MKVIVAGGRDFHDYETVCEAIRESGFVPTVIISGGATGVDALGEQYARENNLTCEIHKADWKQFGKAAGPIRNRMMAQHGEALVAVWDGFSPGTKNMIDTATKHNLKIYVKRIPEKE